ncbi:unnamed protein product, partial [marine sediment metagenome]
MALEANVLYTCENCGNTLMGIEWEEHSLSSHKDSFKCPSCGYKLE